MGRKEAPRNAERRAFLAPAGECSWRARSDLWQLMEFSKRFKIEEVWPADLIAKKPSTRGTLFEVLFKMERSTNFHCPHGPGFWNHESNLRIPRIVRGIPASAVATGMICSSTPITTFVGCVGPSSMAGDALAVSRRSRPLRKAGERRFYGFPDGKAVCVTVRTTAWISGWYIPIGSSPLCLEHWHSGSMPGAFRTYRAFRMLSLVHPTMRRSSTCVAATRSGLNRGAALFAPTGNTRARPHAAQCRIRSVVRRSQLINKVARRDRSISPD